ncbi:serine/threonine-protein kinase PLK4-like isoform X2 [Rhopilema esculentum]|uniref:serine/threonine-protein kinase PLK4-like isoform X2 n=1 Tax=Rhopilema esculentum TaxID=499914 RepID=UPI0031E147BA
MAPSSSDELESIKNYRISELLGKGGFAHVYKAYHKATGKEVAIKIIDKIALRKNGMASRVRNEVEIHCQLKNPSILELYSYLEDDDHVYLILEMCHNGDLKKFLENRGSPLNEREAQKILLQVLMGVLYLHSHGILHRDLTMGNLLLTADMQIKIADFGLAAKLKLPNEKHYTMCGTPNFISPEIATRSPHGLESDVWSLGCLLFNLLVGKPPFDTEAVRSTLNKVVLADYVIPKSVSPQAANLITQLLRKNPNERITLAGILDHPFMTQKPMYLKENSQLASHSMDSGNETMRTEATNTDHRQMANQTKRPEPLTVLTGIKEIESEPLPPYLKHPPSPPVRLRSRQNQHRFAYQGDLHKATSGCSTQSGSYEVVKTSTQSSFGPACDSNLYRQHRQVDTQDYQRTSNGNRSRFTNTSVASDNSSCDCSRGRLDNQKFTSTEGSNSGVKKKYVYDSVETVVKRDVFNDLTNKCLAGPNMAEPIRDFGAKTTDKENRPLGKMESSLDFVGKKKISSTLETVMEPLNVRRLRPIRQKTRNVVLSILEDETVCLEFIKSKGKDFCVTEVFRVSSDGNKVTTYQTNGRDGAPLLDRPGEVPKSAVSYAFSGLPQKLWKKYQYADKFVRLVRMKSPKITFYSEEAKCVLMENSPNPDFEATFYNGAKVHISAAKKRIICSDGKSYELKLTEDTYNLSSDANQLLTHAQLCLEHCKKLESCFTQLQHEIPQNSLFPVTVSRRPANIHCPKEKSPSQSRSAVETKSPLSPPVCGPSSVSVMSYEGTVIAENRSKQQRASQSSRTSQSSPSSVNMSKEKGTNAQSLLPSKPSAPSQRSPSVAPSDQSSRGRKLPSKNVFVPGIGWASQLEDGEVCVQYNDGTQLKLQRGLQSISFSDAIGNTTRYGRTDKFPPSLKIKLSSIPSIIELLAART